MGYVDPDSYYFCTKCNAKVFYYDANHYTYICEHESGGSLTASVIFCDECDPGGERTKRVGDTCEIPGWGDV